MISDGLFLWLRLLCSIAYHPSTTPQRQVSSYVNIFTCKPNVNMCISIVDFRETHLNLYILNCPSLLCGLKTPRTQYIVCIDLFTYQFWRNQLQYKTATVFIFPSRNNMLDTLWYFETFQIIFYSGKYLYMLYAYVVSAQ